VVAALAFAAVVFAIGLSSAPQLHDALHGGSHGVTHQCAATLLSSGSVDCAPCAPLSTRPVVPPPVVAVAPVAVPGFVALRAFARLEHAPPSVS
jgi:hypothetical protein